MVVPRVAGEPKAMALAARARFPSITPGTSSLVAGVEICPPMRKSVAPVVAKADCHANRAIKKDGRTNRSLVLIIFFMGPTDNVF